MWRTCFGGPVMAEVCVGPPGLMADNESVRARAAQRRDGAKYCEGFASRALSETALASTASAFQFFAMSKATGSSQAVPDAPIVPPRSAASVLWSVLLPDASGVVDVLARVPS